MRGYFLGVYSGFAILFCSCSVNYPDGYLERFYEFEQNWYSCYTERFVFPDNPYINGTEYLKCEINGKNVLINDNTSGFKSTILYESRWTTGSPSTPLGQSGAQNWLHITFLAEDFFREIALVIKYPQDSLNYTIQNTLKKSRVLCSSNFVDNAPFFEISTICKRDSETDISVRFSTLYSYRDSQYIDINKFTYKLQDGIWRYHLEYSFDELQITNVEWNPTTMTGMLGDKRESDLLVENIPVRDLKCVIEFELPQD